MASNVLQSLESLTPALETIPVAGGPISALIKVILEVCRLCEAVKANEEKIESLASDVCDLSVSIVQSAKGLSESDLRNIQKPIEAVAKTLQDAKAYMTELQKHDMPPDKVNGLRRLQRKIRILFRKTFDARKRADKLLQFEANIGKAVERFGVAAEIQTFKNTADLLKGQRLRLLSEELKPVHKALFSANGAPSGCLPGTRLELLKQLKDWAASPASQQVLWLSGLAGTGKSTVIRSICEELKSQLLLLATFIISRDVASQRSPEAILHTLVYYCAKALPEFFAHVVDTLTQHPETTSLPILDQVEHLFLAPLKRTAPRSGFLVIVLDAFDECEWRDGREGGNLLPSLLNAVHESPVALRLLIASRTEKTIEDVFARHQQQHPAATLRLHDIEKDIVQGDIALFYRAKLGDIARLRRLGYPWPSEAQLEQLVRISGVLFVHAATVIRFVDHPIISPVERLDIVLRASSGSPSPDSAPQSPFRFLDIMYTQVLLSASGHEPDSEDIVKPRVRSIVATLVLLQDPLSISALSRLLSTRLEETQVIVDRLSSVLRPRADAEPVRLFHPSFSDFFLETSRHQNPLLHIAAQKHHGDLAYRCLIVMNGALKQDICGIGDAFLDNKDVQDLAGRIARTIPEELRYACTHWHIHLCRSSAPNPTLVNEVATFVNAHLLHWIEALGLLGVLRSGLLGLPLMLNWMGMYMHHTSYQQLRVLTHDADRMLQANHDLISSSTLQLYHSVVTFMPNCALYRRTIDVSPPGIRLVSGKPPDWSPHLKELLHPTEVMALTFMWDGGQLISVCSDGVSRVWNTWTQECISAVTCILDTVYTAALSPDGKHIAFSGKGGVSLWDALTGTSLRELVTQGDISRSISFSLDGSRVCAGSRDGIVRVWSASTGNLVAEMTDHAEEVLSVAFSPVGRMVVSGSEDGALKIWDADASMMKLDLTGHTDSVRSTAFSPDGLRVVSGADDRTIAIWDAETGERLRTLRGHARRITSVIFASGEPHIISCSEDGTIREWDATTGECLAGTRPHVDMGFAVLSPDGLRIATQTNVTAITVWDAVALPLPAGVEGHAGPVTSIAFAPDGDTLASSSEDKTVRVWNTKTGEHVRTVPHDTEVFTVIFSPHGCVAASGSGGATVRLFHAESWEEIGRLQVPEAEDEDDDDDWVVALAFSADGSRIGGVSYSGTVGIWSVADQVFIATFFVEEDSRGIAFSPDMAWIASARFFGDIEILDSTTGQRIAKFIGCGHDTQSLAFSPDGGRIIVKLSGGNVHTADIPVDDPGVASRLVASLSDPPPRFSWQPDFRGEESIGWLCFTGGARQETRRVCWFPPERRARAYQTDCYAWFGNVVAVASDSGTITILDVSEYIAHSS